MKKYLKTIFLHLDGIALSPIYEILNSYSINQYLLSSTKFKMTNIIDKYKANPGYFTILFKILESQGVLSESTDKNHDIHITEFGKKILSNCHLFEGFKDYYKESIALINDNSHSTKNFEKTFHHIYDSYSSIQSEKPENHIIKTCIQGGLIAPVIILESFAKKRSNPSKMPNSVLGFLQNFNYLDLQNNKTAKGKYFLSKCHAYGVPSSYMRTFCHLEDLLFGDYQSIWKKDSSSNEYHVNRSMNVWGSGKSHKSYFKDMDIFVESIFNKPLDQQPHGISDMGCGDGSFLLHLYNLIKENTIRGNNLETHPLHLVGADYNQAALDATLETFKNTDIRPPITVLADIANPDNFNKNLKSISKLNLSDLLNVRSFLDHNRTYNRSTKKQTHSYKNISDYSYCWKGEQITNIEIQDDLVHHFKKWKKYTDKHGLLVIELHSTNINLTKNNLGSIPMISYMSTHGFSDQFILEHDVYKECLHKAGFDLLKNFEITYPNKKLKMVSVHMLR